MYDHLLITAGTASGRVSKSNIGLLDCSALRSSPATNIIYLIKGVPASLYALLTS